MNYKIVAVGEVLWDIFPDEKKVGGAPGNFAYHCRKLGADGRMISRVGNDALGHELLDFYRSQELPVDEIIVDDKYPTGAVDVTLSAEGHPSYVFRDNVAWDHIQADEKSLALIRSADAICYGTLASRKPESFFETKKMIFAAAKNAIRIFDVNLRAPHYQEETVLDLVTMADVLKLNDDEIAVIGNMLGHEEADLKKQAIWLRETFGFQMLILTCGENGSLLITENETSFYRSDPVKVVDTVGAGDCFSAAALIGFLRGDSLDQINRFAADRAAYVCTQQGAMPEMP